VTPNQLAALAEELAHGAGAILMSHFGTAVSGVSTKSSPVDPVSDADRASEDYIAAALRKRRPNDAILSEEGASAVGGSGLQWIVDPLDGTVNFLYGIVNWSVTIACADEEGTLIGCVHQPTTNETFLAVRGHGAWLNGAPLTLDGGVPMNRALVATGFAYDLAWRTRWAARIPALLEAVRDIRRPGSAALDLCWVACGRVDAYIERSVMPWDWMAGALIVSEAGGEVIELPATDDEPFGVAASRPGLAAALAELMTR
jgi:myo-inositol-1(or 4)-monophosphatase